MRIITSIRSIRLLLFALLILCVSTAAFSQIGISVSFGPPALPVYEQPPCPDDGYMWTPGYWAYDNDNADYYWVPGTWVEAPEAGLLWTPGYWGWRGGGYFFNEGYWGEHVGFYGGISYGFGYFGDGYQGGRWDNGHFFYNRSVTNVNVTNIHNVYNTTVINHTTINRVSYNGGTGGVTAHPRPEDEIAAREKHIAPVAAQTQHMQTARANPQMRAKANQGKPPIAATPRPGAFNDRAAEPAKAETPRPENNAPAQPASHAKDLQAHARPEAPNTGNAKTDQKYQQQQQKLYAQQEQDHQKLQQKQDQDHQQLAKQQASAEKNQQLEQKHQQQTQQMEQKHTQQQQQMQTRQQPASKSQSKPPEKKG